jgi:signal transduction histidine kinase
MGIFGASALVLIGVMWWATVGYLEEQNSTSFREDVEGLAAVYRRQGPTGLAGVIQQRVTSGASNPGLYLLVDGDGKPLAGNLQGWPDGSPDATGWYNLQGGQRLLVAQDQGRLEATRSLVNKASLWTLGGGLVLALLGGLLMSYSVMRRIEAINRASREIMTGRLQSRMPVRGVNDEFDQLSENLNAMLDRIDSLIEGVKSVADNIAHDLRTPLTRLRGRLENLMARPGLDEKLRDELTSAMTEADQLLATFRALLRIARIESGTHDREWAEIDLRPLLEDAWELYQAVGEEKDIAVHLGPVAGRLRGDRDLLFQALCNLLDNAIKYSHSGSEVILETTGTPDGVNISVADRGPGVPLAERDKVVDRFYRSASVTGVAGSGLGLSLVNAIAHHHGGQLVLSDNAPGLRATLQLPGINRSGPAPITEVTFAGVTQ